MIYKKHNKVDDMTPEEEKDYIDEINDYFCDFIKAAPYVEIGEVSNMQKIKLRANIDQGTYSVGEIIFELQMRLHIYKKNHPGLDISRMVVSKLEISPDIANEHFCPRRGLFIDIKYIIPKF